MPAVRPADDEVVFLRHVSGGAKYLGRLRCRAHRCEWPCAMCTRIQCTCPKPQPSVACPATRQSALYLLVDWRKEDELRPLLRFPRIRALTRRAAESPPVRQGIRHAARLMNQLACTARVYMAACAKYGWSPVGTDMYVFARSSRGAQYISHVLGIPFLPAANEACADSIAKTLLAGGEPAGFMHCDATRNAARGPVVFITGHALPGDGADMVGAEGAAAAADAAGGAAAVGAAASIAAAHAPSS